MRSPSISPWSASNRSKGTSRKSARAAWARGGLFPVVVKLETSHEIRSGLTAEVIGISLMGAGYISNRFFPSSDRPLMVVKVNLPEGSHFDATSNAVEALQAALKKRPSVISVAGFAGRSVPHFYYNLPNAPNSPGLGNWWCRPSASPISNRS